MLKSYRNKMYTIKMKEVHLKDHNGKLLFIDKNRNSFVVIYLKSKLNSKEYINNSSGNKCISFPGLVLKLSNLRRKQKRHYESLLIAVNLYIFA